MISMAPPYRVKAMRRLLAKGVRPAVGIFLLGLGVFVWAATGQGIAIHLGDVVSAASRLFFWARGKPGCHCLNRKCNWRKVLGRIR